MRALALLLPFLLIPDPGRAAPASAPPGPGVLPSDLHVERIGPERGLPSSTVTALLRDRPGFLWVGTREGLAVYDGYTARVFEHSASDPRSLSDNDIRVIAEDRQGRVWIGTNSGGLNLYDRGTRTFERFRHDDGDPRSLSHDSIYAIHEDRAGRLWVGTQKGLNRREPDGRWTRVFPDTYVYSLYEDRHGVLWVCTIGTGLQRLAPDGSAQRIPLASGGPGVGFVFSAVEGRDGRLWVGTSDGLYQLDPASRLVRTSVPAREVAKPGQEANVTSMVATPDGTLWFGTWRGGLLGFRPDTGEWRRYAHDPARPDSLGDDRVVCLAVGAGGEVWVGTYGGGLNRFRAHAGLFDVIGERTARRPGLSVRDATSVLEDRAGRLWVGSWGSGVNRRDPGRTAFDVYGQTSSGDGGLATTLSLAEGPDGTIWAGSMTRLGRVDPRTGEVALLGRRPEDPNGIGEGYVTALLADRQGDLWVGLGGNGLERIPHGRTVPLPVPADLTEAYVTTLYEDADGSLWVGTRSGGLNRIDRGGRRLSALVPRPGDPTSLPHHNVRAVLRDRRGTLWVGTNGGGVARLDEGASPGRFRILSVADGLVNDNVSSMLEDDDGSLWIGTRRGLSRYDPASGRFANFGTGDGLPSLEFQPGAAARGREHLLFGTSGGVLLVRRGTPFVAAQPSPTVLTSIRDLRGPLAGIGPAWAAERVEVPYGTVLAFQFAVLDFRSPHRFAYRLEGKSENWVELGASREVTFTDLEPGEFALRVRGRNAQGVWSETARPLALRIVPPFWMAWWFRALVAAATLALFWTAHRLRTSALERRNAELERLQRERELAQRELHRAYEGLRSLTRRLEDAKEEERQAIARELHDEMGQALSAAKINLKVLADLPEGEARRDRLRDAVGLVDRLIGHVRALSLDLRPPLLDELGLVPALRGYAEGQAQRTAMEIAVVASDVPRAVPSDTAITAFRIVQESITNAGRHAGARRVTVSVRHDPGSLYLSVRDDGSGFDVHEALRRAATGKHLGLLGMRERVEALGGTLEIDSAPGRGTEIRARVPLEEAA